MSDIKKGEAFMKGIVKASLHALFAIGVKSPLVVDRFIISFTENFEKQMELLTVPSQPQTTVGQAEPEVGVEPPKEKPKKKRKKK